MLYASEEEFDNYLKELETCGDDVFIKYWRENQDNFKGMLMHFYRQGANAHKYQQSSLSLESDVEKIYRPKLPHYNDVT